MFRSYKAFTGKLGRLLTFIVYPIAIVTLYLMMRLFNILGAMNEYTTICVLASIILACECYQGYGIFGGVLSKKMPNFRFLDLSNRGQLILKKAFCFETLRTCISITFIYGIIAILGGSVFEVQEYLLVIGFTILFSCISVIISKLVVYRAWLFLFIYLCDTFLVLAINLLRFAVMHNQTSAGINVLLGVIVVLGVVGCLGLTLWSSDRKVRKERYER